MSQDARPTNRRTFLRKLAAGTSGLAVTTALAGCSLFDDDTEQSELTEAPTEAPTATSESQAPGVGIYLGDDRTLQMWESWFGQSVDYYSIALFRGSWEDYRLENWPVEIDLGSIVSNRQAIITFSMFPRGTNMEQVAAGDFTDRYRQLASEMIDNGMSDAHLRFGAELNGDWGPDTAVGRPKLFVEAWKKVVTAMRSVSESAFNFVWAPDIWKRQMDPTKAYPGDEFVDEVGLTFYDKGACYPYPAQCTDDCLRQHRECTWEKLLEGRAEDYGLNFWTQFAREHGKSLVFPEYGVMARERATPGGGDNPQFFRYFNNWIQENVDVVGWHSPWSWTAGPSYIGPERGHNSTDYPFFSDASVEFRRQFGNPENSSDLAPRG
jgi:hypothetical protein